MFLTNPIDQRLESVVSHPHCVSYTTNLQCRYDIKVCAAQGGHWSGMVEVEAHVVNIRNAVAADDEGLLKPLLKRWQDEACSQMVFGLPAVRAVINFKWDR
jgi:hypothetical protein